MRLYVADGYNDVPHPELIGDFAAAPFKGHRGLTRGEVANLYVRPVDPAAPSGPEQFKDGLFGGEAPGEVLDTAALRVAVLDFRGGEYAFDEPLSVTIYSLLQATAGDHVNSVSQCIHGRDHTDGTFREKA